MPFKSKSQARAMFAGLFGKKMQKAAPEWAAATKSIKKLPNHVKSKKR